MTIALITGGSRGLGKNMALHLADRGVDLVITYREREAEAMEVVKAIESKGRKAAALQLDVSKSQNFASFAQSVKDVLSAKFKRPDFDFLVNNAGHGAYVPFMDGNADLLDSMYQVHFRAPYLLSQALLPAIKDGGRILNISSGLTRMTQPGSSVYASMKAAVETLTRYMAKELGPRRITVNVIAPGPVETDFGGGRVRDTPELNKMLAAQTALGRVGLPDDIGPVVADFLTGQTSWITAQRIEVSGGTML